MKMIASKLLACNALLYTLCAAEESDSVWKPAVSPTGDLTKPVVGSTSICKVTHEEPQKTSDSSSQVP